MKCDNGSLYIIVGYCEYVMPSTVDRGLHRVHSWRDPCVCSTEKKWTASGLFNPDNLQLCGKDGEFAFKSSKPAEVVKARPVSP